MALNRGGQVYKYIETATPETDDTHCTPPNSRIVVTTTRTELSETELYAIFSQFGTVEYIKILTTKPVAFIKFDRASSAETVIENAASIIIGGVNPKIFLAETKADQGKQRLQASSLLPDDLPPRSRLFVVLASPDVPAQAVESIFAAFPGFASFRKPEGKPVAFVKFNLASEAAIATESIIARNPPEIKAVMPAEAKGAPGLGMAPGVQVMGFRAPRGAPAPYGAAPVAAAPRYGAYAGPPAYGAPAHAAPAYGAPAYAPPTYGAPSASPRLRSNAPSDRLFIVTGRNIGHDDLAPFLSQFPGFQALDLKVDPQGIPKGFAYASFASVATAGAALPHVVDAPLNGAILKAVYAEPRADSQGPRPAAPRHYVAPVASYAQPQGPRYGAPAAPAHFGGHYSGGGGAGAPYGGPTLNDDIPRAPSAGIDPDFPPGSRLFYVLSPTAMLTPDNLISLFRRFPGLQYLQPQGGVKNYGFVKYESPDSAAAAAHELNGKAVGGGTLKVVVALPTTEKGPQKRPREYDPPAGYPAPRPPMAPPGYSGRGGYGAFGY